MVIHARRSGRRREIVQVVDTDDGPTSGIGDSRCDGIVSEAFRPVESRRIASDMLESVEDGISASLGWRRS